MNTIATSRRIVQPATQSVVRTNVISIGGPSRSGSTLLSLLLNRVDGLVAVGELRHVWGRGLVQNMLCGCGEPFRRCRFWTAVFQDAFGGFDKLPAGQIEALQRSVGSIWYLPNLIGPIQPPAFERRLQRLLSYLGRLVQAIRSVSGAATIVDSSKLPTYCFLLSLVPQSDVHLVHLVRDSRAVAFSQMRKKLKPDIHWRDAYMMRFSPSRSALHWNALNISMEMIMRTKVGGTFLRYEDLMRNPLEEMAHLVPSSPHHLFDQEGIELGTNHMVSGNPVRFAKGKMRIAADTQWEAEMSPRNRRLITAMTWPLLVRYGYAVTRP